MGEYDLLGDGLPPPPPVLLLLLLLLLLFAAIAFTGLLSMPNAMFTAIDRVFALANKGSSSAILSCGIGIPMAVLLYVCIYIKNYEKLSGKAKTAACYNIRMHAYIYICMQL